MNSTHSLVHFLRPAVLGLSTVLLCLKTSMHAQNRTNNDYTLN